MDQLGIVDQVGGSALSLNILASRHILLLAVLLLRLLKISFLVGEAATPIINLGSKIIACLLLR
jgi:hypothetical protein